MQKLTISEPVAAIEDEGGLIPAGTEADGQKGGPPLPGSREYERRIEQLFSGELSYVDFKREMRTPAI